MTNDPDPNPSALVCEFIPVPEPFHSFLSGEMFDCCMMCEKYLLDDGTQYHVERAFVQGEPIYEFALCLVCVDQLMSELSKESLVRLEAHFEERVDFDDRRNHLLKVSNTDVEPWIERCILTGKLRSACRSYAIYAHCDGPDLLFAYHPYMISEEGMTQLSRLLSKKTRDRLDDFTDEFLGLPPELKGQPDSPQFVPL